METFELLLIVMVAVLLSSVLESVIPRVSTPLVQIALGAVLAFFALTPVSVTLDPEFFLPVFIAPLLFNDAKHADKAALWKNRGTIVSLAIGLVVALMLAVGFMFHALVPSVPLAAAFALGAALGPTDAVAVSSLKSSASLKRDDAALLSGESLINDASGVVAFQFAVAAAVTGAFSVVDALGTFAVQFFGGIAFGLLAGWLSHLITSELDDADIDSPAFHVTFDVTLPFIVYIASEAIHVSGILAVVTAGLLLSSYRARAFGPSSARSGIVSASVWDVLEFVLNGIVFVFLGMQIPSALSGDWAFGTVSAQEVVALVLLVTAVLVLVRLAWVVVTAHLARDGETGRTRWQDGGMRSALVTTVGGAKGAVTMAVIMSTPLLLDSGAPFPGRDLLVLVASGVIVCTLLLANFLLPVLAPRPKPDEDAAERTVQGTLHVLRNVVSRLPELADGENGRALTTVSQTYRDRIARLRDAIDEDEAPTTGLRLQVVDKQIEHMQARVDGGQVDATDGMEFIHRLERIRSLLKARYADCTEASGEGAANGADAEGPSQAPAEQHAPKAKRPPAGVWARSLAKRVGRRMTGGNSDDEDQTRLLEMSQQHAVDYLMRLQRSGSDYPAETVNEVLARYTTALRSTQQALSGSRTEFTSRSRQVSELQERALGIELEEVRKAFDDGEITRADAKRLRENAYMMRMDIEVHMA